jgi:hypothetical protein
MATSHIRTLQDIANQIKEENQKGKDRIPSSETFIKKMMTQHSKSSEEIFAYLEQLRELHFIFVISLVQPDADLYLQAINGYVYADPIILNEVKHQSEQKLVAAYENTLYKRKSAFQITRELFTKVKEFNNTPLGIALNETVMIEEYIRIISANAFEYSDSWRKEKLYKLFKDESGVTSFDEFSETEESSGNANPEKHRYVDPGNSKWSKAVNQFSIEFLVKIHFRKYEFDIVKKLINTSKITMIEDLMFVRNTLKDLEKNLDKDTILKYHLDKIIELRRIAQGKINIIRKVQQVSS